MIGLLPAVAFGLPLQNGAPFDWDHEHMDPRLMSYGIYTSGDLKLNDGVKVRPWRTGVGGDLRMGTGTTLNAYTWVRGDWSLGRSSGVFGDLRLGGIRQPQAGALAPGAVVTDTSLHPLRFDLPNVVVAPGASKVVERGDTLRLAYLTNTYSDVTVRAGGTLILRGGAFQFRSLVLNSGSNLVLESYNKESSKGVSHHSMRIDVTEEFLADNARMTGGSWAGQTVDARALLWCYSGTAELHLNGGSRFLGTLAAPRAKVSLSSSVTFEGSLWAREVEIHQYNGTIRFQPYVGDSRFGEDYDLDGIPDSVEFRLGTDPILEDTDRDGLSDGLEFFGRSGVFGASAGITTEASHYNHSWGWALDTTRRDLMNPLRRDLFLRLVWQDSTDIRAHAADVALAWDAATNACVEAPLHPSLFRTNFDPALRNPAYLDRMVELFADPSDKPWIDTAWAARVPDYTVVLHLDAGQEADRNLDLAMPRYGGGVLVSSGGVDRDRGPYSFDINGDGRLNAGSKVVVCGPDTSTQSMPDERRDLMGKLFEGWTRDPLRDVWTVGVLVATNAPPYADGGYALEHFVISLTGIQMDWSLWAGVLHEYGHTLGLMHHGQRSGKGGTGLALTYDGVMNYAYSWGRTQRCVPQVEDSWGATRWCGAEPLPVSSEGGGIWSNWTDFSNPWFVVRWWRDPSHTGGRANADDTILYESGGRMDPQTAFRQTRADLGPASIGYSAGTYCTIRLDSLREWEGLARCRDRHGRELPLREPGTPIDWNANGIIDLQPPDLFGDSVVVDGRVGGTLEVPWFVQLRGAGDAPWPAFDTRWQQDHADWTIISIEKEGALHLQSPARKGVINLVSKRFDLKGLYPW